MQELFALKDEASQILKDKFGIAPEKSTLTLYTREEWDKTNGEAYPKSCKGLYLPRDYSAHIATFSELSKLTSKLSKLTLFHEYFGHGLQFEHTKLGQYIHLLEKKLEKEEKETGVTTEEERSRLRANSPTGIEIKELSQNSENYHEGFAVWMEWYLSRQTGNEGLFKTTIGTIPSAYKESFKILMSYYLSYGEHALIYSCGFPKHHTPSILESTLKKVFLLDFNSINFALVFGSRKPYSDIDMLIVSDRIRSRDYDWLDLSSITKNLSEDLASKLDISVTDPIFTGEFICGDRNYFEQEKTKVLKAPITREAIQHNRYHAEIAKATGLKCEEGSKNRRTALRYHKSYLLNAKELEQGRKALTLKELVKRYPEEFSEFTS